MEIPIKIHTTNANNLIKNLFDGNKQKEIILDRAKLRFKNSSVQMERTETLVYATITMLTPFGAAPVSNYLHDKLSNDGVTLIEIGDKKHRIFNRGFQKTY